eukprot:g2677.t1
MQDPPCLSQAVPGSTRDEKDADWMRLLIMREARTNGAAAACKKYGVPYWKARTASARMVCLHYLVGSSTEWRLPVMPMLKEHLGWDWMEGGPDGSARTRVHRIRKNVLKFTDKKASVTNPKKYTIGNILKMYQYLDWVPTIPLVHLLFMDEVNLRDSDLYGVQACKSYPGQHVVLQQDLGTDSETAFSGTLITSLRHPNGAALVSLREGTNSALDWQDTVMAAYEAGMFVRGDKLILDNARVHTARDVVEPLKVLLAGVGVELVFLTAYSPEFNPCELAFGMVKSFMRKHR